ncbi:tRNA (adenosine(37)-N6)-threonylcarbamoyltransferase complex transferase subunit TsaD [Candidatus Dojkabacteria bacterium]|jgi:N6-L-threonylcarbamoyladenine synthase|nr:tRNA (adenosine(37)-N6)-threonylcarbamoyltransferase complex transferase subunit TsaD [Candidatus Dojkabacteria bacterium]
MKKSKKDILIIAFDTSCDETSVAVLKNDVVLSSVRYSQVDLHAQYGGVVPMIARRAHEAEIQGVYEQALKSAKVKMEDIDYIAVTQGPGLAIDLEVGIAFAKQLYTKYNKPIVVVNHMEGHMLSGLALNKSGNSHIKDLDNKNLFPALALLVSGKHTELIAVKDFGKYEKIGLTLDDAAGEAFDKVGRMLNFGYPGGPIVSEFAKKGRRGIIPLPIPMEKSKDLNFSFSGLKTACLYKIKELREQNPNEKDWIYDFCRSFVNSVNSALIIKLIKALDLHEDTKSLFVGGGVIQNEYILRNIGKICKERGIQLIYPKMENRGDNASMIGIAAYYNVLQGKYLSKEEEILKIDRNPRLSL